MSYRICRNRLSLRGLVRDMDEMVARCCSPVRTMDNRGRDVHGLQLSFDRLIPLPDDFRDAGPEYTDGMAVLQGHPSGIIQKTVLWRTGVDLTRTDLSADERLRACLEAHPNWEPTLRAGMAAMRNMRSYGVHTVYDWRSRNWGIPFANEHGNDFVSSARTVNEGTQSQVVLTFDTNELVPMPVIRALAKQHPSLDFRLDYTITEHSDGYEPENADEDGDGSPVREDVVGGGVVIGSCGGVFMVDKEKSDMVERMEISRGAGDNRSGGHHVH